VTDMQSKRRKKPFHVVTIGGGSGQYALLSGLRDIADIRISAVVSMMDSGGSTGRLRDELGTLPPVISSSAFWPCPPTRKLPAPSFRNGSTKTGA
jgi:hypothetical protein